VIDGLKLFFLLILPQKTGDRVKPHFSGCAIPAHRQQAISSRWLNVSFSGYNKSQYI